MAMNTSKVVWFGDVLIDLTADTVTADKILSSYTAHDASGTIITGSCDFDVNSQDATVKVAEILNGQTAYARGTKLTGTMPNNGGNNGGATLKISSVNGEVTIAQGYHDGSAKVGIADALKLKLIAANIKQGITILGVTGTLLPSSSLKIQSNKTVTPAKTQQSVTPDTTYDYLAQVTVNAIPYVETDNAAGGKTVTIG